MKRAISGVLCLAAMACADEGDDSAQVVSSASAGSLPFESNTLLELTPLDSADCDTDATALTPGFAVLEDAQSFRAAYLAARLGSAQVPSIDFASYVVVEAVVGGQGGCGASVALVGAVNRSEAVEVQQRTGSAACSAPAGQVRFTFAFAQVSRLAKPYVPVEVGDASGSCAAGLLTP